MIRFFRKLFRKKIKYLNGGISVDLETIRTGESTLEKSLDCLLEVLRSSLIEEYEKLRRDNA